MTSRAGNGRCRRRARRFVLALAVLAATVVSLAGAPMAPPRTMLLGRDQLESADSVRRAVSAAAAEGFGAVMAPLSLAPEEPSAGGFDPIAETLERARQANLAVYASLDLVRANDADEIPVAREHVLYQHPDWLMVPRELAVEMLSVDLRSPEYVGRLTRWTRANAGRVDALYVSPLHPEAVSYVAGQVAAVLRRYAVAGVHLAGVSFPDTGFDYSARALDLFRERLRRGLDAAGRSRMDRIEAIDPFAYPEEYPEQWREFRQAALTALVASVRAAVREARPGAMVSADVTPDAATALREHLQDWRHWLDRGIVDAVASIDETSRSVVFALEGPTGAPPVASSSRSVPAGGTQ